MPIYINGALAGMGDAVYDKDYQKKLSEKTTEILGDKESISLKDLKKMPLFSKAYDKLDATGKKRFDQILSLDGDAKNISEKELKTLLTVMDADLHFNDLLGKEVFLMDGEPTLGETGGLNQAREDEIQHVYQNTKTRAEIQADEMKKMKEISAKLENIKEQTADYDINNGADLAKAFNVLDENISKGNSEGVQIYDMAISNLFGGKLERFDTYRDGGSREYFLKDGTKIYRDNGIGSKERGFTTITRPDGTVEKYNTEGVKVE